MTYLLAALPFAPVLIYLLFATLWSTLLQEFKFTAHAVMLGVMAVAHLAIGIVFLSWWMPVATLIIGLFLYILFIYFFGGKASGETLFVVAASFMLTPLFIGVWALIAGIALIIAVSAFTMRKNFTEFQHILYSNASVIYGMNPGYDDMTTRSEADKLGMKKVYAAPYFLLAFGAVMAVNIVRVAL